jgi:curved DNA-binding protein CbpA
VQNRIQEMKSHAEALSGKNYYEILGVSPEANKAAIQTAFFQLAKVWHPDRLTDEYDEIRECATRAFSRMSEAHQVLCDEERRQFYDKRLAEGGDAADEQEQIANVLRAVTRFQKAEVLFKKGNLAEAETEAQAAAEADPGQPDYVALHAWIVAQRSDRQQSGNYDDLIRNLDAVIEKQERHERARFVRGQLLKRAGQIKRAMRDFRWVADNNPQHLDAAREIRLYRMRKGGDQSASGGKSKDGAKGSLFGKLFKR